MFFKIVTILSLLLSLINFKISLSQKLRHFKDGKYSNLGNDIAVVVKPWKTLDGKPTVLIAHRGERVLLPAHSLPGYETAGILGADFVEPDLYLTKDNVLVCFHDLYLKDETDIESHSEFDHLRRNYTSAESEEKGVETATNDWVIKDFTLEELRTLRIKTYKVGIRPTYYNLMFGIPTFQEYLNVIHRLTVTLNRTIGIIPEIKFPAFHNIKKSPFHMEDQFLKIMALNGYATVENQNENCVAVLNETTTTSISCPPVIVQSFHHETLKYLRSRVKYELMILLGIQPFYYTPAGFQEMSKYVNYVSLWKDLFLNPEILSLVNLTKPESFIRMAHNLSLKIAVFTIKDSREFTAPPPPNSVPSTNGCGTANRCPPSRFQSKIDFMNYFFDQGIDALFIENVSESLIMRINYILDA